MGIEILSFYHPLPRFGEKLSNQWNEFRDNFSALAPLIRSAFMDIAAATGSHDLAGMAFGELAFRNRYRVFYDKAATEWKIQFNEATNDAPSWIDFVRIRNSDGRFIVSSNGGLESLSGFYNVDFLQVGTAGVSNGYFRSNVTRFDVNALDGFYWSNDPQDEHAILNFESGLSPNPQLADMLIFDSTGYREARLDPNVFYTSTGGDGRIIISTR